MTNEQLRVAFNVCDNWLSATGGERFKEALKYMRDAAIEKLAKQEFNPGDIVEWIGHSSQYSVIVTNGESRDKESFCGTVINGNHPLFNPGTHSAGWIKSEFRRV